MDDIVQINNAAADRLRYRRGFKDGAVVADGHTQLWDPQDGALSLGIASKGTCRMAHLSMVNTTARAQDGMALLTLGQRDRSPSL